MNIDERFYGYLKDGCSSETAAAILVLAEAVAGVATQIKYLGNGDACTPMGALEAFAVEHKAALQDIAAAIQEGGAQ